ncbi:hypothetical protein NC661_18040 [Aquibacillus koreensis]|uniref:Uncharacterized protein n=1 Tax=Aquibacillus koreensis TaxID=279446 RepID=A0A9X3WRY6_9BACI|nr:hypothetical protein [Aquibacillus koreensis]MCT2535419.1 hypothetical protein [Aquibacillus koreensis]MDC3422254.1 hypothetical protein [Aquibacillus koreensis]
MSIGHYHGLCNKYRGRAVEIRCHGGKVHKGIIEHVDRHQVFLRPIDRPKQLGGYGYGWGGYGSGLGWGVALGSIATLSLLPLFFW